MIGYKIVKTDFVDEKEIEIGYVSMLVFSYKDRIQYKIGEWAESHAVQKEYKLTFFNDRDKAITFFNLMKNRINKLHLFKCKVKGVSKKIPPMLQLFGDFYCGPPELSSYPWPDGTCMASKVMLVEEIKI